MELKRTQMTCFPKCVRLQTLCGSLQQGLYLALCIFVVFGACAGGHRRRSHYCGQSLVNKLLEHCHPRGIHRGTRLILEQKYNMRQRYTRSLVRQCCRDECTPEKLERYCARRPANHRYRNVHTTQQSTQFPFTTLTATTKPNTLATVETTTSVFLIKAHYEDDINEASANLQHNIHIKPVDSNKSLTNIKDRRRLIEVPAADLPRQSARKGPRESSGAQSSSGTLYARLISERDAGGYTRRKYA